MKRQTITVQDAAVISDNMLVGKKSTKKATKVKYGRKKERSTKSGRKKE